jgi:hypothetical protein
MHLREKMVWCKLVVGFFLNRPFWYQQNQFKPKKQGYFSHTSLVLKHSAWPGPTPGKYDPMISILRLAALLQDLD